MSQLTDWIKIFDHAVPNDLCDQCLGLFDSSGVPVSEHTDFWRRCKYISLQQAAPHLWAELRTIVDNCYTLYKRTDYEVLNRANKYESPILFRYEHTAKEVNYFNDHADNWNLMTSSRAISVIVYLNDVAEGGETIFTKLGAKVAAKKGRVLLFPSYFTYIHRGEQPKSEDKNIVVIWIHFDGEGHQLLMA